MAPLKYLGVLVQMGFIKR